MSEHKITDTKIIVQKNGPKIYIVTIDNGFEVKQYMGTSTKDVLSMYGEILDSESKEKLEEFLGHNSNPSEAETIQFVADHGAKYLPTVGWNAPFYYTQMFGPQLCIIQVGNKKYIGTFPINVHSDKEVTEYIKENGAIFEM